MPDKHFIVAPPLSSQVTASVDAHCTLFPGRLRRSDLQIHNTGGAAKTASSVTGITDGSNRTRSETLKQHAHGDTGAQRAIQHQQVELGVRLDRALRPARSSGRSRRPPWARRSLSSLSLYSTTKLSERLRLGCKLGSGK